MASVAARAPSTRAVDRRGVVTSLAWFPAGDYEDAIVRWATLAGDWADCAHPDYCRRIQFELLRYSALGLPVRAVAPSRLAEYVPWCEGDDLDPELPATRASYAAELTRRGQTIPWPPGRNYDCWCGSGRKHKQSARRSSSRPTSTTERPGASSRPRRSFPWGSRSVEASGAASDPSCVHAGRRWRARRPLSTGSRLGARRSWRDQTRQRRALPRPPRDRAYASGSGLAAS